VVMFDLYRSRRAGWWALGLAGVTAGLLTLTRAILLLFPFLS
jgi:hypothetical protein